MRAIVSRFRVGLGDGAGFTVIEVVIAAMLLAVTALAVAGLVNASSHNNFRSEQSQVVNDQLQQEMEKIKQLPYVQVALTQLPVDSPDPANPNNRISGTQFNLNHTGDTADAPLVYNGGHSNENGGTVAGGLIPPESTFQSGNVSGTIYRYVVWEPQSDCTNCAHNNNSDLYNGQRVPWFKHVVIAVALNSTGPGGIRAYQELQGDVGNQSQDACTPADCESGHGDKTPWTFWLTDTPCSFDARQAITDHHLAHNTLGHCTDGPRTGNVAPGAPDLMFTQAAPCVGNQCSDPQPLYDYATDREPGCNPTLDGLNCNPDDRGLQMDTPDTNGCLLSASGSSILQPSGLVTDPQWKFHEWLSPQIPTSFTDPVILDGTGNLELWTQTIGDTPYAGKICIWLFVRTTITDPITGITTRVDTPAVDANTHLPYITYACPTTTPLNPDCLGGWPAGPNWAERHIPLNFGLLVDPSGPLNKLSLTPNRRLGLAIGVESPGTAPLSGLQFMYDHPTYDSRLIVDTHSALPF